MRRKDMHPGVLYVIKRNGMPRPGYIFDAKTERIRCRVYWTWPGEQVPGEEYPQDTDYLNPTPDLLSPLAKADDNLIVKTSDVIAEWEPWARAEKAERAARLQARLDEEQQEKDAIAAERASDRHRLSNVSHLIEGATGYLSIDHLASDLIYARTQSRYSAKDVLELLEAVNERVQRSQRFQTALNDTTKASAAELQRLVDDDANGVTQ